MLAGTALASAGLVVAALSTSTAPLFASLVVFGIGSAVVPMAGAGALFRAYPPERRGWALGVRQMSVPLGGTIAAVTYPGLHALGGTRLTLLVTATAVAAVRGGLRVRRRRGAETVARRVASPFRTILRAPGMQRLLAVAACYIVVLQALLAYVVPAVREAGRLGASTAGHRLLRDQRRRHGRPDRLGPTSQIAQGGSRRVRTLVEVGSG